MQPGLTKLARPATSVLRIHARSSSSSAFVCTGCLQSRQHLPLSQSRPVDRRTHPTVTTGLSSIPRTHYSTSTNQSEPSSTAPPRLYETGLVRLTSRRLISVSGPDAAKYLQGVITANITNPDGSPRTDPFYAAFLTAKGRVLHDVFIYPYHPSFLSPGGDPAATLPSGESFLIEVDASEAARLQQHIKRYKLRAKFDVRLLEESELETWHAWGGVFQSAFWGEKIRKELVIMNPDPRAPGMGGRILTRFPLQIPGSELARDSPMVQESAYTLHRYSLGVPEGQREILRDQALPLESNIDVMGGIDFRKGCYVGQELTIRTKHRGVVRKRILPVVLSAGGASSGEGGFDYKPAITSGGEEQHLLLPDTEARIGRKEKPDRRVGQFLGGIGNVGLALCRLEVMTDLQVPGETAAGGYNPEKDEFVVSAGTGRAAAAGDGEEETAAADTATPQLRVRAFVPKWLREELEKPAH